MSLPPFLEHARFLQCFTVAVLNVEVLKTKHKIFLHTLHLAYALPCLAPEPRDQGRYFCPSHHQFLSSVFGISAAGASAGIAPCPTTMICRHRSIGSGKKRRTGICPPRRHWHCFLLLKHSLRNRAHGHMHWMRAHQTTRLHGYHLRCEPWGHRHCTGMYVNVGAKRLIE